MLRCASLDSLFVCCGVGPHCGPCYPGTTNLLLHLPSTLPCIGGSSQFSGRSEEAALRGDGLGCRNGDVALPWVACPHIVVPSLHSSSSEGGEAGVVRFPHTGNTRISHTLPRHLASATSRGKRIIKPLLGSLALEMGAHRRGTTHGQKNEKGGQRRCLGV